MNSHGPWLIHAYSHHVSPIPTDHLVAQKEIALTVTAWGSDGSSMPRAITALLVEFLRSRSDRGGWTKWSKITADFQNISS